MNFDLTDDQCMMRDTFARLLEESSPTSRVREVASRDGFDDVLWAALAEMGAFAIRLPEEKGGLGLATMDALLLAEEAGKTLACGPLVESLMAVRALGLLAGEEHASWIEGAVAGTSIITLAMHDVANHPALWVAGGNVAHAVLARRGSDIVLFEPHDVSYEATLASTTLAELHFDAMPSSVVASGAAAVEVFDSVLEEWKLLMAVQVSGMARQAVKLAAEYACEREAFGKPIGQYQGISHPLADLIAEIDGGKLIVWKAVHNLHHGVEDAGAQISMSLWWNIDVAGRAVTQALHTFGGYGLATEYDVHLYNLRAKQLPMVLGDHDQLLSEAGRRLYGNENVALPDVGDVPIDFELGEEADNMGRELAALFEQILTPELKAKAHYSFDGFDRGVHKILAEKRFLFPAWPKEYGGRDAKPYVVSAMRSVWQKYNWTTHPVSTTDMVGTMIRKCGNEELKQEVLTRIMAGDAICSLGYSEPSCGSDVFAAKTRATPDGDGWWRIDGSKMWTSGANIAQYVLMLVRTDPDLPKHKGLTMFVVPLDTPGIEVQAVHTFQDERTNITYYDGVRIPDRYRLGEVNGGLAVMSAALELEHSGGFTKDQRHMVQSGEALCREISFGDGKLIDTENAQRRLARARTHLYVSEMLEMRALFVIVNKQPNLAYGPMIKLFSSEKFQSDSRDLLSLGAPYTLSKRAGPAGALNLAYRHAHGSTIYGGTSEVHRSMIAEKALGLPRSRG